jgi:hypothetical protein
LLPQLSLSSSSPFSSRSVWIDLVYHFPTPVTNSNFIDRASPSDRLWDSSRWNKKNTGRKRWTNVSMKGFDMFNLTVTALKLIPVITRCLIIRWQEFMMFWVNATVSKFVTSESLNIHFFWIYSYIITYA